MKTVFDEKYPTVFALQSIRVCALGKQILNIVCFKSCNSVALESELYIQSVLRQFREELFRRDLQSQLRAVEL